MSETNQGDEFLRIIRDIELQPEQVVGNLNLAYYSLDKAAHADVSKNKNHEPVEHSDREMIVVKYFVGQELYELYIDKPEESWIQIHEVGLGNQDRYVQDRIDATAPPTMDQLDDMKFVTILLEETTAIIKARNAKVQIMPPKPMID